MKNLLVAAAMAASMTAAAAPAQAALIFSQNFDTALTTNESVGGLFGLHNGTVGHNGGYSNYEYSWYDLSLDLTNVTDAWLYFDYAINIESYYDRFNVLASTGAFAPPAGLLTPTSGMAYSNLNWVYRPELGVTALADSASGRAEFDLAAYSGQVVNLRFQFGSDGSVLGGGVNLDNLAVTGERITSAVPEPATWAMMIVGFFGAGAMLRRSRAATALA